MGLSEIREKLIRGGEDSNSCIQVSEDSKPILPSALETLTTLSGIVAPFPPFYKKATLKLYYSQCYYRKKTGIMPKVDQKVKRLAICK